MAGQEGFFDLGDSILAQPSTAEAMKKNGASGCMACGLFRKCKNPRMAVFGEGEKGIMIVGEAPGAVEDDEGVPFVGASGRLLSSVLDSFGIDMDTDCWRTNVVQCRPTDRNGENRAPSHNEINQCRLRLIQQVDQYKPKVILALGTKAVDGLLGHRISGRLAKVQMSDFFGEHIPDQEWQVWIAPTYHPAWVLRQRNRDDEIDGAVDKIWRHQISEALKLADKTFPQLGDDQKNISTTTDPEQACEWIAKAISQKQIYLAFDYETSGIKPHMDGHKIISASISYNDHAWAFPFFYAHQAFLEAWKKLMEASNVLKIAHKMDFEDGWTYWRGGIGRIHIPNWGWDTCLAAHCIHNRKPVGQKFLVYCNFGIMNYDKTIDSYLKASSNAEEQYGKNAINRVDQAPLKELLKYNALDSLYCNRLFIHQKTKLKGEFLEGFKFYLEGARTLSEIQYQGMQINEDQLRITKNQLSKFIARYETAVMESDEVQLWPAYKKTFNPLSNIQLGELLYKILGNNLPDGIEKTGADQYPVTEEALKKLNTEFCDNVISLRKLVKRRDTYLSGFEREAINGVIRPFFNLHTVVTFRSSSDSPNFQNMPKRDIDSKKLIRGLIRPPKGCRLVEYDYKGMEVSVAACVFKDPTLIQYVSDPTKDMHRDTAMDIFFRGPKDWTKAERQAAKNGYVFPAFYGSVAREMARGVWEQLPETTIEHLHSKGIPNLEEYTAFLQDYDKRFWGERFPVYRDGKQSLYRDYQRQGYVDLITGFRCWGPLEFTEVTNYPVQGPAFHCLLWALNHIHPEVKRYCKQSAIIGQIHDALIAYVHPDEAEKFDEIVLKWSTQEIRNHWQWIIVPLTIEKEQSEIDGNLAEMNEAKFNIG